MGGLLKICTAGVIVCAFFLAPSITGRTKLGSHSMSVDVPRYGLYRIYGRVPKGFERFYEFELVPPSNASRESEKGNGRLTITGALFVRPSEFQSTVQIESRGDLSVDGAYRKVDVVRLGFRSATLVFQPASSNQLEFETEAIQGIHYIFKGTFIDGFLLPGGPYISLRGTLTKFTHGKRTAESELNFERSSYE